MTGPYSAFALEYRKAGWQGVIPIGRNPGEKSPPPRGYTGYAGLDPSGPDIYTWSDGPEGARNVGLHLPLGIYVLDADERNGGVAGLAELVARAGVPLPATISSTARGGDSPTRQYFYRAMLPAGRVWRDHPAQGLDSLHVGHRYAVVAPSVHPSGAVYAWYGIDHLPGPDDLAELPPELIEACSQPGEPLEGVAASDGETIDIIKRFRVAVTPCPRVTKLLGLELDRMAGAAQQALHVPGQLYALTAYGLEGHAGVAHALSLHQAAHIEARTATRGEAAASASAEWWRMVRGAVGKKLAESGGAILPRCDCDRAAPEALPLSAFTAGDVEGRLAAARAYVATLAGYPDDQLHPHRDMLKASTGLTHQDFWAIVKAERQRLDAVAKEAAALAFAETGEELSSRAAPMPVARELHEKWAAAGEHLRFWRGDWYLWRGAHWSALPLGAVRARIYANTESAWFRDHEEGPLPWNPDTAAVNKVLDAMGHGPAYRDDALEAERCIAASNGVLDPVTHELVPHDPARFNLWSLPYPHFAGAGCSQWLAFLDQVMPDEQNRQLLQEWFGYMVSGRTDLHKILSLFGVPRSGKGTVLRVLVGLIGEENRATITLGQLAARFGREALIGRTLAQVTDANWNIREIDVAAEALKSISGDDDQGIDRKNRTTWEGRLGIRFVLVANATPRFNDPSGALLSRMLHIEFTRSFLGIEDESLTPRLLSELPGILNWALAGLASLTARGKLPNPRASIEAAAEIRRTTSPVAGFIEDRCVYGTPTVGVHTYLDDLYASYRTWAARMGIERVMTRDVFSQTLQTEARGKITKHRVWVGRGGDRHQTTAFCGIDLFAEPAPPFAVPHSA